jgi:hypothetical protein
MIPENYLSNKQIESKNPKIISIIGDDKDVIASNVASCLANISLKKRSLSNILLIDLSEHPRQNLLNKAILPDVFSHKNLFSLTETGKNLEDVIIQSKEPNLKLILGDYKFCNAVKAVEDLIYEKIEYGLNKISSNFSAIIMPTSSDMFSNLLIPEKYIAIKPDSSFSRDDTKRYIANTITINLQKAIKEYDWKDAKAAELSLPEFMGLIEKNRFDINNLYEDIKKMPYNVKDDFLKFVTDIIRSNEFGLIPVKADEDNADIRRIIAKEKFLFNDLRIFCPGQLNYGTGKKFSDELSLIKESTNSGKPLILHQYDKKSLICKKAIESDFVKSIESISKYIMFGDKPEGYVEHQKAGRIIEDYDKGDIFKRAINSKFAKTTKSLAFKGMLTAALFASVYYGAPEVQKAYDKFRYPKLIDHLLDRGTELSRKKDEISRLNTKLIIQGKQMRVMENYVHEKEAAEKNLEESVLKTRAESEQARLELTKKTREAKITAKKLELTKLGYDDKLQYAWKANAAARYLEFGAQPRKGRITSEEENMLKFELLYKSAQGLDSILGPDFEKEDLKSAIAGKARYKIEKGVYAKDSNGFDLESEEISRINGLIAKLNNYAKPK